MTDAPLLTTDQVAELIQQKLGVPCPVSRIMQDRHHGRGPKAAAEYGRRLLYTPEEALTYGRTLIRPLDATASPTRISSDRATVITTAIKQIVADTPDPDQQQLRIKQYLRNEIADLERQIAADRHA